MLSILAQQPQRWAVRVSLIFQSSTLNLAIAHLSSLGSQDQVRDKPFPPERPRKDAAIMHKGCIYYIHVHVIENGSDEHRKQLKYRDYLLNKPIERKKYELYKKLILADGFTDQEEYGKQKSPFVKTVIEQLNKS